MTERRVGVWVSPFVTMVLSLAAAVTVICGVSMALGLEDTEPLESPLLLPVARQLIQGPWGLYGPFGGQNPWVLIHAPLYYRIAALVAWPLMRAGVDPVMAALAAGRAISLVGLGWTMAVAYRIARLDGAPRVAGAWAALLIAASLVVGAMPYAIRADMLGVALHTTGVFLVLSVLRDPKPGRARVPAAYAAFGLALCVKQLFIVGPVISTFLLLAACVRGRLSFNVIASGLMTGLAIVVVIYGAEELASVGQMSRAVFQAAASTNLVHPVGWGRATIVIMGIIGKSGGLMAVFLALGLANVGTRTGVGSRALVVVGSGLLSLFACRVILEGLVIDLTGDDQVIMVAVLAVTLFLLIPACWLLSPRSQSSAPVDRTLGLYLAAEAVLVIVLSRASAGAWVNYGIQAVVFASIIAARALGRICSRGPGPVASSLVALAVLTLLTGACIDAWKTASLRHAERVSASLVIDYYGAPATEFFFVDRPGLNRLHGRLNLVYDDWLYPVFEAVHLAEPRSIWLRRVLDSGEIRFVVNTSENINIGGLGQTLPQLGYTRDIKLGETYYVWRRSYLAERTRIQ
jgi:hypothetical protein